MERDGGAFVIGNSRPVWTHGIIKSQPGASGQTQCRVRIESLARQSIHFSLPSARRRMKFESGYRHLKPTWALRSKSSRRILFQSITPVVETANSGDQRRIETRPREETFFEEGPCRLQHSSTQDKANPRCWAWPARYFMPPNFHHITNATLRVARYDIMSLACGILNSSPQRGRTDADDAKGDHTTVPLDFLNLSFLHLVPRRKHSRRSARGEGRGESNASMFPLKI